MREKILSLLKKSKAKIRALTPIQFKVGIIASCTLLTTLVVVGVGGSVIAGTKSKSNSKSDVKEEVLSDEGNIDLLNVVLPHSMDDADTKFTEDMFIAQEEVKEEAILEMIEDTSQPVKIISYEELDIGEDDSSETVVGEVVEETPSNSTNIYEYSGIVKGIDVSKWQGDIDWSQVAASGVKFAIIKCAGRSTASEGSLYEDPKFEQNIQGAIANGIQVGVYFFSQALSVEEAYQEASMTIQLISKYQITYPVCFDWESADGYRVANRLDRQQLTDICNTFAGVVASYGYTPMIYFNRSDWRGAVNTAELTSKYKTWLAVYFKEYYYTSNAWDYGNSVPEYPDIPYDVWQYGVTDTVPGINGWCDMDIAFFSYGNYEVQGLQEPGINFDVASFTLTQGCDRYGNPVNLDEGSDSLSAYLRNNAHGKNCIGYDVELEMTIRDLAGNERDYTSVITSPGSYIVSYSFVDPRNGMITKELSLNIISKPTESPTETETETESESETETETETGSIDETSTGDETSSETESESQSESTSAASEGTTGEPSGELVTQSP